MSVTPLRQLAVMLSVGAIGCATMPPSAAVDSRAARNPEWDAPQEPRWRPVYRGTSITVHLDTTRIVRLAEARYDVWWLQIPSIVENNTAAVLIRQEIDCYRGTGRLLAMIAVRPNGSLDPLSGERPLADSWVPDTDGEGRGLRTCEYIKSRP